MRPMPMLSRGTKAKHMVASILFSWVSLSMEFTTERFRIYTHRQILWRIAPRGIYRTGNFFGGVTPECAARASQRAAGRAG